MAVIKCKMCGGDIVLSEDKSIGTCDSCGSTMTLPRIDDEQRAAAFNRGNHFRRIGEFDKALAVYEHIVEEHEADAEAHWCCALCRFGIEYVEDPTTHEWLPTCHRASFDSFLEDVDYLAALEHADPSARERYRQDAEKITEVQRGILSISQNEKPFDVFICYKETDENGQRTRDSLLAQEIYYGLTEQGCRVFFARITLEDKVGTMYEPYIFAALHSARVMVVVGTSAKNLNAVWVRNEWSRFLALMRKDRNKLLLPCYRDMDPYDMPEQLSVLQAYDMSKIGFLQDLVRGVNKVLGGGKEPEHARETLVVQGKEGSSLTALLRRGELSLEDGEWKAADEFFDRVLDMDAECAVAYRGKFLAGAQQKSLADYTAARIEQARSEETSTPMEAVQADEAHIAAAMEQFAVPGYVTKTAVKDLYAPPQKFASVVGYWRAAAQGEQALLANDRNLKKARAFAAGAFKKTLEDEMSAVERRWNEAVAQAQLRDEQLAQEAKEAYARALKNGDHAAQKQYDQAMASRESDYQQLCKRQAEARQDEEEWQKLGNEFQRLGDYKDSVERAKQCAEKKEAAEKRARNRKRLLVCAVVVITAAALVYFCVIQPAMFYRKADELLAAGDYEGALAQFEAAGGYGDAAERVWMTHYAYAEALLGQGDIAGAAVQFEAAGGYGDAAERVWMTHYAYAEALLGQGDIAGAAVQFGAADAYEDAWERSFALWDKIAVRETVSAGGSHTVGLKADGTVVAVGDNYYGQCDVDGWTDIVAVSAGDDHTVGLKADGTVVAVGYNLYGQCDVDGWTDIVAVSVSSRHTVGLKADGTVVAVGDNDDDQCDVDGWTDIVAVSAGDFRTVGLKADGTVVAVGSNLFGQCDVDGWTDIVAVSAGGSHTVGLKADGTVVAVGDNYYGQCDVDGWTDIVAVSAGDDHTVGLKADGTVVAVGYNLYGQCDVDGWTDIVAVSVSSRHTVGLKADGTVVAVGDNGYGRCDVDGWTDIVAVSAEDFHTVGLKADGTVVAVGYNGDGRCDVDGWTDILVRH